MSRRKSESEGMELTDVAKASQAGDKPKRQGSLKGRAVSLKRVSAIQEEKEWGGPAQADQTEDNSRWQPYLPPLEKGPLRRRASLYRTSLKADEITQSVVQEEPPEPEVDVNGRKDSDPLSLSPKAGRPSNEKKPSPKTTEQMKISNRRLKLGFQLTVDVVSSVLAIVAFFLWTSPSFEFSDMVNNWKLAPIVDISLVPLTESCPAKSVQLQAPLWGNDYLCDCGTDGIRLSTCFSGDTNCKSVSPVKPAQLPSWRSHKICVTRHPFGTEVSALNRGSHCSSAGWKNCTTGADPICVPETTACPLTDFQIVVGGPNMCPTGSNASPLSPGTLSSVYICTSNSGSYPLVDASITLGGRCTADIQFNPYSSANPQKQGSLITIDVSRPPFPCGQNSDFDRRFVDVDLRQMGDVLSDNGATLSPLMSSSDYVYWTNNSSPLFYKFQLRPEIPFSEKCPIDRQGVIGMEHSLYLITYLQTIMSFVNLSVNVLFDIPWLIYSMTPRGIKNYKYRTALFLIKALFLTISNIINIILISIIFYFIWSLTSSFNVLSESFCGDSYSQTLFNFYSNEFTRTMWLDVVILLWCIAQLVMEIRLMIILPDEPKKRKDLHISPPMNPEMIRYPMGQMGWQAEQDDDLEDHEETQLLKSDS